MKKIIVIIGCFLLSFALLYGQRERRYAIFKQDYTLNIKQMHHLDLDSLHKRKLNPRIFCIRNGNEQKIGKRKRYNFTMDGGPLLGKVLGNTAKSYWETAETRWFSFKNIHSNYNTIPSFQQFMKSLFQERNGVGIQDEFALRNNIYNNFMPSRYAFTTLKNNSVLFLIGFRLQVGHAKHHFYH